MPHFGKLKDNIYKGCEAMLPTLMQFSPRHVAFTQKKRPANFDYDRLAKIINDSFAKYGEKVI